MIVSMKVFAILARLDALLALMEEVSPGTTENLGRAVEKDTRLQNRLAANL